MEMKLRPMTGYVFVEPSTLSDGAMEEWLRMGVSFVRTNAAKRRPRRNGREAERFEVIRALQADRTRSNTLLQDVRYTARTLRDADSQP